MKQVLLIAALLATPAAADIWGDAADAGRHVGDVVSGGASHTGAVLSDAAHHAGRVISDATKAAAGNLTDDGITIVNSIDDNVQSFVAVLDPVAAAKQIGLSAAGKYYDAKRNEGNAADCTVVVGAVCAYYGTAGGPIGAALGAGGGVVVGRWACSNWYPN